MATVTIRPDGDSIADWSIPVAGSHYLMVDDAVTYPTDPTGDTDWIAADGYIGDDDNDYDQFTFGDTPVELDEVSEIKIYLYGAIDNEGAGSNYPEVSYDIGGGFSSDYQCSSFPNVAVTPGASQGDWHTITLSGLSWTKTQIDALQIRIRADVPDGTKETDSWNWIWAIQVLVTYSTTGYSAGKPLGVVPANVAKVMGVEIADIGNIKGV